MTPQTSLINEVIIKILPPEEAHLSPDGQIRSDRLPPLPANCYVGTLEAVERPEPVKKTKKKHRR